MRKKATKSSNTNQQIKSAGIIGVGHLGTVLSYAFDNINILKFILARHPEKHQNLINDFNNKIEVFGSVSEIDNFPQVIFITVPDSEIYNIAKEIADNFSEKLANTIFIHCSGSLGLSALAPLETNSKGIAALHPFQTFYNDDEDDLYEIAWTIQCDESIKAVLRGLISRFKGRMVFLDNLKNFNRNKYHLSAIFAANYLSTTLYQANSLARDAGVNPETFIMPIATSAFTNNSPIGDTFEYALTGPIARGDIEIIKRHIESLNDDILALKSYVLMGLATAETAFFEKILDESSFLKIKNLFLNEINNLYS